ncbi:MAG: endonuclease/exonuclease/phosphatase family protein [Deltaproteobacteria bacterium]|nr:endonuclease/exonuclease/phosphatase family protein [Deltaproteobacteria bacterium]
MRRRIQIGGLAWALLLSGASGCREAPGTSAARVATFNIRRFGVEATDLGRLSSVLLETRAAVVAVQEIEREAPFEALEAALGRAPGGGRWAHVLSQCGGGRGMRLGFLYDASRVALVEAREYPELDPGGGGRCGEGERPGLLGVFAAPGGPRVHLVNMHLPAGPEPERVARRRVQWDRALAVAAGLRRGGASRVLVLGDANSTGWAQDAQGERTFIEGAVSDAGLALPSGALRCTEYWRGAPGVLVPSLLDHVAATPGVVASARVGGYCARLACARIAEADVPEDYRTVSDHCPVVLELR